MHSLYYASSVWLSPSLSSKLKSNLFLASGKILSTIEVNSYRNLHKKFTRATPEMWQNYELAISLYDLTATKLPLIDWQLLQGNILQNRRSTKLHFTSTNKLGCGLSILPNHFKKISNWIDSSWLTLTKETYKQNCKKEFITTPLQLYWFTNVRFVFVDAWFLTFNILTFFCKKSSLRHLKHCSGFQSIILMNVFGLKWFNFSVMTIWYVCIIIYYYVKCAWSNKFTIHTIQNMSSLWPEWNW